MNPNQYKITLFFSLILLAIMLGIFALYSHTIMPGLKRTSDAVFVNSFQSIDRQIINPIFMLQFFVPLFLLGIAAFYAHKHHLVEAKYLYIGFACYLIAVIVTMAVNIPLNDGIKKVTDTTSPESLANARSQFDESKWLLFNNVRTLFTLIATGCTSAAIWISKLV